MARSLGVDPATEGSGVRRIHDGHPALLLRSDEPLESVNLHLTKP